VLGAVGYMSAYELAQGTDQRTALKVLFTP
jgi:hypothetical protein